jgi:hypothetical protein
LIFSTVVSAMAPDDTIAEAENANAPTIINAQYF